MAGGQVFGGRLRVMVVDDHPMWREAVARDLAEAGFEVVATAGDGAQAVRRAAASRPQVLLLDLHLPLLPGAEVCRQVLARDPSLRVLVLSASGEQADVLAAVKSGASGYLVKSAGREELLEAVRRTAAGRRSSLRGWPAWCSASSGGWPPSPSTRGARVRPGCRCRG